MLTAEINAFPAANIWYWLDRNPLYNEFYINVKKWQIFNKIAQKIILSKSKLNLIKNTHKSLSCEQTKY